MTLAVPVLFATALLIGGALAVILIRLQRIEEYMRQGRLQEPLDFSFRSGASRAVHKGGRHWPKPH